MLYFLNKSLLYYIFKEKTMNQNNLNLNIILPTYNEEKNVEFIIPQIFELLSRKI